MGIKNNPRVGGGVKKFPPLSSSIFFYWVDTCENDRARVQLAVSFLVSILKRGVINRSETTKVQDSLVLIEFRFILFLFMYKYTAL